jgi:OHCU decarboxylase
MTGVAALDALPEADAEQALLACCGSRRWAAAMAVARPFGAENRLLAEAERRWWALDPDDWLEAFRGHPRIGERETAGARTPRERAWSEGEQGGMRGAGERTRADLADGNRRYEERFGHIFLICATDRSPQEMLGALRDRLGNDAATELRVAAGEQARITRLRLRKWIDEHEEGAV